MKKLFIFIFLFPIYIFSHDLQHKINKYGGIVGINLFYADNTKFSFESYEIYSPENEKIPFQVGRTDKYGRIFLILTKKGNGKLMPPQVMGMARRFL